MLCANRKGRSLVILLEYVRILVLFQTSFLNTRITNQVKSTPKTTSDCPHHYDFPAICHIFPTPRHSDANVTTPLVTIYVSEHCTNR